MDVGIHPQNGMSIARQVTVPEVFEIPLLTKEA